MSIERSRKFLQDLLQLEDNNQCAECNTPNPEWASYNLGVFLCDHCAGLHRHLGTHLSKIKSISLDKWDEEQLQFMSDNGNGLAKQKFEPQVPVCYRRPSRKDPQVMKEQWIRAKYERKEFTNIDKQSYLEGFKEGTLYKRGKDQTKFKPRKFVLNESENTLKYFNKDSNKCDPKAVLRLDQVNVVLVPEKVGNPNAMQITYDQDGSTRNLYVFAETGKDIIDWYTAIRSARLNRLRIAYPGTGDTELLQYLLKDYIKEGWLSKTGPNKGDAYRKRWFTLESRKLMYFEEPMDAYPKGEIYIGTDEMGFKIRDGVPPEIKNPGHTFTLRTPTRLFHFAAQTESEKTEWMEVLQKVVETPMLPQEFSNVKR